MEFDAVVALDLRYANKPQYDQLDLDLTFYAKVSKRSSPSNTYTGRVESVDIVTAAKILRENITTAFDFNDVHGVIRIWLAPTFMEVNFDA